MYGNVPYSLIGVIPGPPLKQEGVGDDRAVRLFVYLWNRKYATASSPGNKEYRVKTFWQDHDFGRYPEVGIRESLFEEGLNDDKTFPKGIEVAAIDLVDEWNKRVVNDEITLTEWQEIVTRIGWVGVNIVKDSPFQMEY